MIIMNGEQVSLWDDSGLFKVPRFHQPNPKKESQSEQLATLSKLGLNISQVQSFCYVRKRVIAFVL
jgi:hypothetical protein